MSLCARIGSLVPEERASSLCAKIDNENAFLNEVRAQTGKDITPEAADELARLETIYAAP